MPGTTKHPAALDSHTGGDPYGFAEAVDVWRTTLTADAPVGSVVLSVGTTSSLPSRGEAILADPDGLATSEVVTYTGKTATSLTGVSPTVRAWSSGSWVHTGPTARSHNDLAAAIVALETKQGQSLAAPADTPVADRLLGSNASGKSGWIQLLIGMIPDGLITAVKLASNSVTTIKILDANVTAAKLAVGAAIGNIVDNTLSALKLVDATITTAKYADGSVTPVKTDIGVARQNLLANPSFQIWQRGAGAFTADGNKTADCWEIDDTGASSISVTRITRTDTLYPGEFSLQMAYTHSGGANCQVWQNIESVKRFRGRQVTVAFRLKSTVNGTVKAAIFDDSGGGVASAYNSGTGFQTLSLTYTVGAAATFILVQLICDVASCTVEVSEAWFGYGAVAPVVFTPLDPADDFHRCLRRYEVFAGVAAGYPVVYAHAGAATTYWHPISFRDIKGGAPTVTKNGTWSVTNAGQPGIGYVGVGGFGLSLAASASGLYGTEPNSTDDTITAEWNP